MKKKDIFLKTFLNLKTLLVLVISFGLFFLITIIFNKWIPVFTISGVRPSAALNPVLGIAFGWPAAIGCALGNFVSDLVSGYGINVALLGFIPQIVYGILPYYIWKLFVKSETMRTRLDSPIKVVAFVLLMAINSIIIGVAVGLIQLLTPGSSFLDTATFACLNDFGVSLAFGLPLLVLLDHIYSRFIHKGKRKLSGNEKIVLISSLCQLFIFGINILIVYLLRNGDTNLEIWKSIFATTLITTCSILLISILIMQFRLNSIKKNAGLMILSKKHGTIYVDTKKCLEFVSLPGDVVENNDISMGYQSRKALNKTSYENSWLMYLCSQKGCIMNCAFCDCPGCGFHGNVSREEFIYQVNTIIDTHYVSHSDFIELDFTRMGEPTLNSEILEFVEFDLIKTIKSKIDVNHIIPCISTMLPRNKMAVENFILNYCRIKNETYNGKALLQFSIHSSDDKIRSLLMRGKTLPLDDISDIAKKMPTPKGYKYTLSFAVGSNLLVNPNKISELFDKEKFLIKLTPIHSTYSAIDHGFDTMNKLTNGEVLEKLKKDFVELGFDVVVCDDSIEEDDEDLSCGKLVLPSIINDKAEEKKRRTRYGIIAALKYEEDLFRAELTNVNKITLLNKPAYTGILGDNEVIIMQCGMGKVSAGICAQAIIDNYHPDYIINTGCAGSLDSSLKVGDIVVSNSVVEWDLDLRMIGLPLGYIDALGCVEMKASDILKNKILSSKPENIVVKEGAIASGDQFVSTNEQRKMILQNFPNALCAEMEGAAIGHVCLQNDIPFCVIRSMSDTADGNSGIDFEKFAAESSKISAGWLINMLKKDK